MSYSFNPEYMGTLPWGQDPVDLKPNQIWFSQNPEGSLFSWYMDHWVEVSPSLKGSDMITITLPKEIWKAVSKAINIALAINGK